MIVEILRCPKHATFWAVSINDLRVTPSKCCGAWSSVARWKIHGTSFLADARRALRGGSR